MSTENKNLNIVEIAGQSYEIPQHILDTVSEDNPLEKVQETYANGLKQFFNINESENENESSKSGEDDDENDEMEENEAEDNGEDEGESESEDNEDEGESDDDEEALKGEVKAQKKSKNALKQQQDAIKAWFKGEEYDYETEEEAIEILKLGKSLKEKARFINELEKPFAEDRDMVIAQFKKSTGILGKTGETLAEEIVLSNLDDLKQNPVRVLAIAKAIDNPKLLSKFTIDDFEAKIISDYRMQGVDVEDTESMEYKFFAMDAELAAEKVEKFREKFGGNDNPYAILQSSREQSEKQIAEQINSLKAEISNLGLKNITRKVGDIEISLEAPKDLVKLLGDPLLKTLAQQIDPSTKEGKKQLRETISKFIVATKVDTGEYDKAIWKKASEYYSEQYAKEKFNGKPRDINRGGFNGKKDRPTSEIENRINQAWGIK